MSARSNPASPVIRFGAYLCLLYLTTGAVLPYLPVWLREAKGLKPEEIGLLFAAISFTRIVAGPLIAAWSAGLLLGRTQYVVLTAAAIGLLVLYGLVGGPVWVITTGVLFGIALQTLMPLTEAEVFGLTESRAPDAEKHGPRIRFGFVRALASGAFVIANLVTGVLIGNFGVWSGYGWILATLSLAALATLWLPASPRRSASAAPSRDFGQRLGESFGVLRTPGLLLAGLGAACIQSAHGFYYSFSSNLWIDQGIAPGLVGMLWSVGVIAEIVFLLVLAPRLDRINPVLLIVIAGCVAMLRWTAYAMQPPLGWIIVLQTLHLATFGMTLIGTMRFIQLALPAGQATATQQLVSSILMAPIMGIATFVAGQAAARFGALGYLSAAALALVGTLLALGAVGVGQRLLERTRVSSV